MRRRGFRIAIPYGEDWDFDLIFQRPSRDALERVQVKYAEACDGVICVRCKSHSLTNGRIRSVKQYTDTMVDWMAVYDASTDRCYYVPSSFLGSGRWMMHLRLDPARNSQRFGVHLATDFVDPEPPAQRSILEAVEPAGLEPATSRMQTGRSPN